MALRPVPSLVHVSVQALSGRVLHEVDLNPHRDTAGDLKSRLQDHFEIPYDSISLAIGAAVPSDKDELWRYCQPDQAHIAVTMAKSVEPMLKALSGPSTHVEARRIWDARWANLGDPRLKDALLLAARRYCSARTLFRSVVRDDQEYVELLAGLLEDDAFPGKGDVLDRIPCKDFSESSAAVVAAVKKCVVHPDYDVRRVALRLICTPHSCIEKDELHSMLSERLNDDEPTVRVAAALWMGKVTSSDIPATVGLVTCSMRGFTDVDRMLHRGNVFRDGWGFREPLHGEQGLWQRAVLSELLNIYDAKREVPMDCAVHVASAFAQDPDWVVREAAIRYCASRLQDGDKENVNTLRQLVLQGLDDPSSAVRIQALKSLRSDGFDEFGDGQALAWKHAWIDRDPEVRSWAHRVFANLVLDSCPSDASRQALRHVANLTQGAWDSVAAASRAAGRAYASCSAEGLGLVDAEEEEVTSEGEEDDEEVDENLNPRI